MFFSERDGRLFCRKEGEVLCLEGWGPNALRIRATHHSDFTSNDWALEEPHPDCTSIHIDNHSASIQNGLITAKVTSFGQIRFYRRDTMILNEYYSDFCAESDMPHSPCRKIKAREMKPVYGGDYQIIARFESQEQEKFFGMGQYAQNFLDLKGCTLELAQRNSQISVPFALSSLGYGFLWNNPAIGEVTFGKNMTVWKAYVSEQMDYWITADDTPAQILQNYTAVTGRPPVMPENVLGLWQCKLRYRTQDEVLSVAREYYRRGIPLDVIVIDFFHWKHQGDWAFDPQYWPDPAAMVRELKTMGIRCMVSIWPTVDSRSGNFNYLKDHGLLIRAERGIQQAFDFHGSTCIYDATNPDARSFIWQQARKNYFDVGVDMFWLDEAEPEYTAYDFDNYRYYLGPDIKVGNIYPRCHAKAFYDGMKPLCEADICNLTRCAWAGSQKYGVVVWSGDIFSNFQALRDQVSGALNMGIAGIPWWTSDIAGFFGDCTAPHFKELMIRWFQFAVFCPVLRMHGDRGPHTIPPLAEGSEGGGFCPTGQPNELWSFGEDVFDILKKYVLLRVEMKPYLSRLMQAAHESGAPVMRPMFYEFPGDPHCWDLDEQYMFGDRYLVAPVLYEGQRSKEVYFPSGVWKNIFDSKIYQGEQTLVVDAPLSVIPVFEKCTE